MKPETKRFREPPWLRRMKLEAGSRFTRISRTPFAFFPRQGNCPRMSEENNEANEPAPFRGSPIAGCIILCTILVVFGGLIVLFSVVGTLQNKKYGEFTSEQAAEIQVLEPTEDQVTAAVDKLQNLVRAVEENRAERVLLTATDLNALIASQEVLADFRGQTWVEDILPGGIKVRMSQSMRNPLLSRKQRFLNASFVFEPELRARTISFLVRDIRPDVGQVDPQFIAHYASLDFFKLDPELPPLKKVIPSLDAVYTENGHVVLETKMPVTPVEE